MNNPENAFPERKDNSLGVLIGLVRSEFVRALEAGLASQGIAVSFTQFLMLKRLATMGAMSATELARAIDLDAGAMTRQLDQLATKGYLRRSPNEQDRRALRIELTEAGEALSRRLNESSLATMDRAQSDLNDEERAHLLDYLQRVLNALRNKD